MIRRGSELSFHIEDDTSPLLEDAVRRVDSILASQNRAISYIVGQYRNSKWSRDHMKAALKILNNSLNQGGKVIVSGIGKSYKIAGKTVATLNSLSVHSALLHPSEALHGDLGIIREDHHDSLVIISASGNSPELTTLLEYVPASIPVVLVTCTKVSALSKHPKVKALFYAELPPKVSEKNLYGLQAPTISTTVCLTLLDGISIALSELHIKDLEVRQKRFGDRHPGGAIGLHYLQDLDQSRRLSGSNGSNSEFSSTEKSVSEASSESVYEQPNLQDDDFGDANDILELPDLKLLNEIKLSVSKITLPQVPEDELELLRLALMYDFLLVMNAETSQGIRTKNLLDIYRKSKLQEDSWDEILWKINDSFTKLSL
ncbi:hypothetical protein KL921_000895 [Ogataea angusta]|nr:hypothetical protein KL921_000895 [Ogataea angusta]